MGVDDFIIRTVIITACTIAILFALALATERVIQADEGACPQATLIRAMERT